MTDIEAIREMVDRLRPVYKDNRLSFREDEMFEAVEILLAEVDKLTVKAGAWYGRALDHPAGKIVTTYVNPPIPVRTSDWCACLDGKEEDGPYGWGATEEEAVSDLKDKLED